MKTEYECLRTAAKIAAELRDFADKTMHKHIPDSALIEYLDIKARLEGALNELRIAFVEQSVDEALIAYHILTFRLITFFVQKDILDSWLAATTKISIPEMKTIADLPHDEQKAEYDRLVTAKIIAKRAK